MPISIFDTRTMLEALHILLPPQSFILDTFFTNVRTFDTTFVDVDIVKGNRKMAPFVSPRNASKNVERLGYETKTYTPPRIAPKIPTNVENLMKRMAGEQPYTQRSPMDRANEQMVEDLTLLNDMIRRREEWMCTRAIFDGKLDMVNKEDGVDDHIDFGLTNKEKVDIKWSDALKAKPIDDLRRWRLKILQTTGVSPNICVMSSATATAFMATKQVLDIVGAFRNLMIPDLNPVIISKGITYITRIPELGISIYSYDEWFYDEETRKEKPMVDNGKVLLASDQANFHMLYGVCQATIEGQLVMVESTRVPRSWTENDPPVRQLAIDSRPLPVPVNIDSIFVGEVL